MDLQGPGRGQETCDFTLKMEDWPGGGFPIGSSGLSFRQATFDDFPSIISFLETEPVIRNNMGWYDQFMAVVHDGGVDDVILGKHESTIVAAALVYTPKDNSSIAQALPWARTIGPDVGGVTCVTITGIFSQTTMIRNHDF